MGTEFAAKDFLKARILEEENRENLIIFCTTGMKFLYTDSFVKK